MTSTRHNRPRADVGTSPHLGTEPTAARPRPRTSRTDHATPPAPTLDMLSFAEGHEQVGELYPGWRQWLVGQLGLRRGQVVIDAGCGSGANFAQLRARVGPTGTIIGIEDSPELRAVAAYRVARRQWANITLISRATDLDGTPIRADAALFCGAHGLLRQPRALGSILAMLRPGARVVAGGWKWPAAWLGPMPRHYVATIHRRYLHDLAGFDQPWRHLGDRLNNLQVSQFAIGTGYLAHGRIPNPIPLRASHESSPQAQQSHPRTQITNPSQRAAAHPHHAARISPPRAFRNQQVLGLSILGCN